MRCGATDDLHFDHVDPASKLMDVSSAKALDGPMSRLIAEVRKCQLLCPRHHLEKTIENGDPRGGGHNKILNPKHGTEVMYRRERCRCVRCKRWRRDYRHGLVDARGRSLRL